MEHLKTIGVLNGPNLNQLGIREPEIYGKITLEALIKELKKEASKADFHIEDFQSNHEGELIDKIQKWNTTGITKVIFNPGAYTHTSIALRDAISGSQINFIEIHISNIYQRESFRHNSFTAGVSSGIILGLGMKGYSMALKYFMSLD